MGRQDPRGAIMDLQGYTQTALPWASYQPELVAQSPVGTLPPVPRDWDHDVTEDFYGVIKRGRK